MKLSKVLLATMLASTNVSLAQEHTPLNHQDSLNLSNIKKNLSGVTADSLFHEKVNKFYAKRERKKKRKTKSVYANKSKQKLDKQKTIYHSQNNCPGCGRG